MIQLLATISALVAVTFPHGSAVIRTPERSVTVKVELARTPDQLHTGLGGRKTLAPYAGMAFLFGSDIRGQFWMKNTSIPLSIAFWGKGGKILRILDMAPCLADPCRVYDPKVAYRGALEVNRGAFKRWGVRPGAVVTIRR